MADVPTDTDTVLFHITETEDLEAMDIDTEVQEENTRELTEAILLVTAVPETPEMISQEEVIMAETTLLLTDQETLAVLTTLYQEVETLADLTDQHQEGEALADHAVLVQTEAVLVEDEKIIR